MLTSPTKVTQKIKLRILSLIIIVFAAVLAACGQAAAPTATPAPTLVPSLTASPTEDIAASVSGTLTAMVAPGLIPTDITLTAVPDTSTTAEGTPEVTETPIVVTLPALAGQKIDPPLTVNLPTDWKIVLTDVQVLQDVDSNIRGFPFQVYSGPVTGGTGTIVLYWGFPNLTDAASAVQDASGTVVAPDLWSDGLRILNLAVVEQGCTVGTDLKRSYRVGLLSGTGTQFSAVKCPQLPDTRGWFAGVQEKGLNFVFYVYVEGAQVMDNTNLDAFRAASDQLQAILDTVQFHVPDTLLTPVATP
ncbi:MAG: hypothetical protein ABI690_26425 [Chloroflexota bacterium]